MLARFARSKNDPSCDGKANWKNHPSFPGPARWKNHPSFPGPARWKNHPSYPQTSSRHPRNILVELEDVIERTDCAIDSFMLQISVTDIVTSLTYLITCSKCHAKHLRL